MLGILYLVLTGVDSIYFVSWLCDRIATEVGRYNCVMCTWVDINWKWNNIRIEDALIVIQPNMILGLDDKDNFTY